MPSFATLQDAQTFGLVASAYGLNLTNAVIQANLDAASAWAQGQLGARASIPILPWPESAMHPTPYDLALVQAVVHIARYNILARRGFDENNAADKNVIGANKDARDLFVAYKRQEYHFDLNESPAPTSLAEPQYAAPLVVSHPMIGFLPGQDCPPGGGPQGVI